MLTKRNMVYSYQTKKRYLFLMFIYFERKRGERESMCTQARASGGGAERKGERES